MMQITRAEIIAVTLPEAHQSSGLFRPLLEFCNQAVSLMLELTITSAPGSEAQILLQRSIA